MRRVALIGCLLAVACGDCGDDTDDPVDAARDAADAARSIAPPIAPAEAALPALRPCVEGWAERMTPAGVPYCHPFPDGVRTCEGATGQRPGERECTHVGAPCPEGEWAAGLDETGTIVFVRPGAIDGDGTRERPLGTLEAALAAAPSGATILLGKGEHTSAVSITQANITIVGACADETTIVASAPMTPAIAVIGEHALTLRDVRLSAEDVVAISVRNGASVIASGLWVEPAYVGVAVQEADADMRDSTFRDIAYNGAGIGVRCLQARCTMSDLAFDHAEHAVSGGRGSISIHDSSIVRTDPARSGHAIGIAGDVVADFGELAIDGVDVGVQLAGVTTIDRLFLHDAQMSGLGNSNATVTVTRSFIESWDHTPVSTSSNMTLRDVVIRGGGDAFETGGTTTLSGIGVVVLQRVSLEEATGSAISMLDGDVTASDLTILGVTQEDHDGFGIAAAGGTLHIERARFVGCEGASVFLNEGAHAVLEDAVVEGGGATDVVSTVGVGVLSGSHLDLRRAAFEEARGVALAVSGRGSSVIGHDVAIRMPQPLPSSGDYGRGLEASYEASMQLARVSIEDAFDHAVLSYRGTSLALEDVTIDRVMARACTSDECARHPAGIGVAAYDGSASLQRFAIRGAALCAAHRAADATLQLAHGVVADSAIGVCIAGDLDVDALTNDVEYTGNGENLNARELPVPVVLGPEELGE